MGKAATSSSFGYDFQTNAAIFIMLENIQQMKTIRVEGEEDIELVLIDGGKILAQAKVVEEPYKDFKNVTTKLKEALESLTNTGKTSKNVKSLVYITNTPKPLGNVKYDLFSGPPSCWTYDELPDDSKKRIDTVLSRIKSSLDTSKLVVRTLPFYSENLAQRNKFIYERMNNFMSKMDDVAITIEDLHTIWENEIFKSGTRKNQSLKVSKQEIIWPVIVMVTRNDNYEGLDFDAPDEYALRRQYSKVINNCTERYEFVTRVLSGYSLFKYSGKNKDKLQAFIKEKLHDYYDIFNIGGVPDELRDKLLQIVMRNIVIKGWQITQIKKVANL